MVWFCAVNERGVSENGVSESGVGDDGGGATVLHRAVIFEPDLNIRAILESFLQPDGFEIVFADCSKEFVQSVQQYGPSISMMDLLIPDGDGLRLCRQIRHLVPSDRMKIVMASFLAAEDWVLEAGADHFLARPLSHTRLRETFNRAVQTLGVQAS